MNKLLILLPLVYLFLLLFRAEQAFTQDLGRHLILGKLILECNCVPKTNLFSYTAPDFAFINHHWLPEVVFYAIVNTFGLISLLWFKIFVMIIASALSLYTALRNKGNTIVSTALVVPMIFVLSERFDVRPEIFSFLFLSLFVFLISRFRATTQIRYLLPLILVQLLWVNTHIYFFIGLLLYGILCIDRIFHKELTVKMVLIGVFMGLATLVNPHGLMGALYPFKVFGNYGYSIVENQSIFFLNSFYFNPRILVFEIMAIVAIFFMGYHLKKKNIFEVLCLLFAVIAGGMMIRNFPLFVFITYPILVTSIGELLFKKNKHIQKNVLVSMVISAMLFAVFTSYQQMRSQNFGLRYVYGAEHATSFLLENKLPRNIFNNFDIGSYLIYRLYPQYKVFVDGRPEAYPAEFFETYKKMQMDPELFERQVIQYDINTVFFAHTDITPWAQQFLQSIVQDNRWVPVYLDERIIIFVRNSQENNEFIQKHRVQLPNT